MVIHNNNIRTYAMIFNIRFFSLSLAFVVVAIISTGSTSTHLHARCHRLFNNHLPKASTFAFTNTFNPASAEDQVRPLFHRSTNNFTLSNTATVAAVACALAASVTTAHSSSIACIIGSIPDIRTYICNGKAHDCSDYPSGLLLLISD